MAKTLSNLQTGTRVYLDEANQTDFLDTEVIRSINYGYHDVVKEVIEVYEQFYETTTPFTYTMVNGTQEYAIDATLIKVTRVEINYNPKDTNSKPTRALPVKSDEILTNLAYNNTSASFFNAGYFLHGNIGTQTIGFVPIPTVSDTTGKSISVWGIALPSDLVNSTDTVNIPYADNFSQLIELKAASILLSKGQQEENASNRYYGQYKREIMDMKTFLKERQADNVWLIQDAEMENIDFGNLGYS